MCARKIEVIRLSGKHDRYEGQVEYSFAFYMIRVIKLSLHLHPTEFLFLKKGKNAKHVLSRRYLLKFRHTFCLWFHIYFSLH